MGAPYIYDISHLRVNLNDVHRLVYPWEKPGNPTTEGRRPVGLSWRVPQNFPHRCLNFKAFSPLLVFIVTTLFRPTTNRFNTILGILLMCVMEFIFQNVSKICRRNLANTKICMDYTSGIADTSSNCRYACFILVTYIGVPG